MLAEDLITWAPKGCDEQKANILIFGPVGHGKSTLINSFLSIARKALEEYAISHSTSTHVTVETAFISSELHNFRFMDTFGLTRELYNQSILDSIVNGTMPLGLRVDDTRDLRELSKQHAATAHRRMIHAVIFVASFRFSMDDDNYLFKTKGYVNGFRRYGLTPLLAMTHSDLCNHVFPNFVIIGRNSIKKRGAQQGTWNSLARNICS